MNPSQPVPPPVVPPQVPKARIPGPDWALIGAIVGVLGAVVIVGTLFVPKPDHESDPAGFGILIYLLVLALGIGMAVLIALGSLGYVLWKKPPLATSALLISLAPAAAGYIFYIVMMYLIEWI